MLNIPSHGELGSDDMVSRLSDKEDDPRDKLMPSVSYLQKLGPEHLQQIFNSSRWIFELNRDIAFEVFFFDEISVTFGTISCISLQIFTSEDVELPRSAVADYLEEIDPSICARYLVFLSEEKGEVSPIFHDRLAELYLSMTLSAKKRDDSALLYSDALTTLILGTESWRDSYKKLLGFISSTHYYSVDRLYGLLSSEGRTTLHQHDNAIANSLNIRIRSFRGPRNPVRTSRKT